MATTYNLPGQANGAGADDALFLKMYGGETMASYNAANIMEKYHLVQSESSGKSFQFPVIGRANAVYWDGVTELEGENISSNEVNITLDDLLYHDVVIRQIDELRDHVSKRQEFTRQQGEALANMFDANVLRTLVLAARTGATITGQEGGTEIVDADAKTNGASLAASIFTAAQNLDEKYVPQGDRTAFVRPAQYYLLAQTTDVINRDWDGSGSYSTGLVHKVADIGIQKTVNLPTADDSGLAGIPAKYRGNFSTTAAVIARPGAARTVKLMGISTEMDYKTEKQGTHLVSKMYLGTGVNRPEEAVEIKTA